jgi:Holliday junction resolvase RusA-like endonuclease
MSDGRIVIAIPDVPPSLNTWLSRHWRVRDREKKAWQAQISAECLRWNLPRKCERIEAEVTFRFPDRRKRDCDNYTATLSKALGDALRPTWIPDDDSTRYWVRSASIEENRGPKLTTIALTYWLAKEEAA